MLHYNRPVSAATANVENDVTAEINKSSKISIPTKMISRHVFLSTAAILMKNSRGIDKSCRVVLYIVHNTIYIWKTIQQVAIKNERVNPSNQWCQCKSGTSKIMCGGAIDV